MFTTACGDELVPVPDTELLVDATGELPDVDVSHPEVLGDLLQGRPT